MAELRELISDMRDDLNDLADPPRFSDAQYVKAIGRAARRMQTLLHRNNIELGRSVFEFSTRPGEERYYLPGDFATVEGLYWPGVREIPMCPEADFERNPRAPELSRYLIREDSLYLRGTPSGIVDLRLVYWPGVSTRAWTAADVTPWSGKLDDLLKEYALVRLRNVDEENVDVDMRLAGEMEDNLLTMFATRGHQGGRLAGWL